MAASAGLTGVLSAWLAERSVSAQEVLQAQRACPTHPLLAALCLGLCKSSIHAASDHDQGEEGEESDEILARRGVAVALGTSGLCHADDEDAEGTPLLYWVCSAGLHAVLAYWLSHERARVERVVHKPYARRQGLTALTVSYTLTHEMVSRNRREGAALCGELLTMNLSSSALSAPPRPGHGHVQRGEAQDESSAMSQESL